MNFKNKGENLHIKNIIWDFDGTIMDTYPAIATTTFNVAKQNKINIEYKEIMRMVKITLRHALEYISEQCGKSYEELFAEYLAEYVNYDVAKLTLFPHVEEVLHLIIKQGGKNYIITHRGKKSLQEHLAQHNIANLFTYCIGGDANFPRKPDPAVFIYLKEKFSLNPQETIVLGDRILDVEAGYGAGFKGILYQNDADFEGKMGEIDDYAELVRIISN